MLTGLDAEIRGVKRLLDQRKEDYKRISLSGVRGAASPEEAASFIPTSGFLPIEVNLRTGSIDRLVELLAGETLYGPNPMAAVRELIQNARDAVMLKAEIATHEADRAALTIPIRVLLHTKSQPPVLEIIDHGVGMSRRVVTDYLISIASNYWTSQFAHDFPTAAEKGFKNAGKFGIGFLSVLMLGDEVTVESNRNSGERHRLTLRGVGRRGELRQLPPPSGSGTAIRIKLKAAALEGITPLDDLVRVYAPTLPHALAVNVDGNEVHLPSGWLMALTSEEFKKWVLHAVDTIRLRSRERPRDASWSYRAYADDFVTRRLYRYHHDHAGEPPWPLFTPEYRNDSDRLVASFEGVSLLCLRGLAVQMVSTPGFVGVVDLDTAAPDVSRNRTVNADLTKVLTAARTAVMPHVVENLNALGRAGFLIDKTRFIASCVQLYGRQAILDSSLPWINQIRPPGNLQLISSSRLLADLASSGSVFVAYNSGPWTAMKRWARSEGSAGANELAVLIDGEGQSTPGYRPSSDREAVGAFGDLWPTGHETPLFGTLVVKIKRLSPPEIEVSQAFRPVFRGTKC